MGLLVWTLRLGLRCDGADVLRLDVNKLFLDPERYSVVGTVATLLSDVDDWQGEMRVLINEEIIPAYRHRQIRFFTAWIKFRLVL